MKTIYVAIVAAVIFVAGFFVGRTTDSKPEVIINNYPQTGELTEWQIMELAIYKTESEWDDLAVGKGDDWGCGQLTQIYIDEVNRILGETKYIHEDAFNPVKTHEMIAIMQSHHNPTMDIDRAIVSHNPKAPASYSVKVRKNMALIKDYEQHRKIVQGLV